MATEEDIIRADIRRELHLRKDWRDVEYAFHMSVRAAMRDRPDEARPVIKKELQQMVDKKVWHGVHMRDIPKKERKAILRSSMFLKDKFLASGAFEKYKARQVAGGDQQDRSLYENLDAPTAATIHVICTAALAAKEKRTVKAGCFPQRVQEKIRGDSEHEK